MTPRTPSPQEIEDAQTSNGGWSKTSFKEWGIGWPPRKGWRQQLERKWLAEHPGQSLEIIRRSCPKAKPSTEFDPIDEDDDFEVIE
jgi:hypothetical protein